eukprot:CAMPEP_0178932090 /NCGR_PEP_ID=MMETSP0786-20121207/22378_1 /TAXON_ID=186022 /ORGANISM="Thalassionema frauenfeldii, Strain CCMP 1798" /LENGTH=2256 /DNA_ID=CAMNT_0020609251 /DNA_START=76 /DNA_END=6846 /DNA_ORIENTATION=-
MSPRVDGWVESVDPNTGRKFYANHVTRVTQWDPPPGWNSKPAAPAAAAAPPSGGLPMGWEEMKDPQSGRVFYVDHANQVTTWTKPTAAAAGTTPMASAPVSAPSNALQQAATTRSSYHQHQQQQHQQHDEVSSYSSSHQSQPVRSRRTWSDSSSYFRPSRSVDVDFSDALSKLDFKVQKVEDALRPKCANCQYEFTLSKRRHHCRLCGDVYCDKCSPHKVELPLEGPEYAKPVRICNFCHPDVERGNYFSQRRYLTPLTLYDPPPESDSSSKLDEEVGVATHATVSAALCALTSDLDALILNASSVELTLEASDLVPAITKHLALRATSDRAVRCLASLLSLGAMGSTISYAKVFYQDPAWEELFTLLERSGNDRKTLYIQEQCTKVIYYLTEASLLKKLDAMDQLPIPLDIPRTLRALLDHASNDKNPNLQRLSASAIRHLVLEEERRLTSSANDICAHQMTSGQIEGSVYQSFLPELVSTGGILILCSLMGAEDADTRTHATAALGATLDATRAMDESLANLYELTGGFAGMPKAHSEITIIRAIVQSGGCDFALSQLLQSSETTVARMGCDFCASLVLPLLEDARGTATLEEGYTPGNDDDLAASREAALALASGPCLPSLLSIVRVGDRPLPLKQAAMECLAAIAMAVGEMTKANPPLTDDAVTHMLEEGMVPLMLMVLEEFDSQSLTTKDTPTSRIREAAGIVISAMAVCSMEAMMELQSSNSISIMWSASQNILPSSWRGDGAAPQCLGMLQTAAALLTYSQHDASCTASDRMDGLLQAVDAGAIATLSRILFTKIDYAAQDKAVGAMKARDAACRMLTAMFDIARNCDDVVCHGRLWDAVDADAYSRNPPRSIVNAALQVLHNAAKQGRLLLAGARRNKGPHFSAAVMDLVESSLYAVGSMCGSTVVPGLESTMESVDFVRKPPSEDPTILQRRRDASAVACDILCGAKKSSSLSSAEQDDDAAVLPTMLIGGFGEKTLMASLRLSLAIAQNGNLAQHAKLASSGILVPLADSLQTAMTAGDQFRFSACLTLLQYVGPHVDAQHPGGVASVQAAIRTATSVLQVVGNDDGTQALKESCMACLEAWSSNASLWAAISKDALPSMVLYVKTQCDDDDDANSNSNSNTRAILGALKALTRIVAVPSHGVAAVRAGLPEALGRVLVQYSHVWEKDDEEDDPYAASNDDDYDDDENNATTTTNDDEVPLMALDILHTLHNNREVRRTASFLDQVSVVEGIVCILAKSATRTPDPDGDGRADICLQGLELLLQLFVDTTSNNNKTLSLAEQLATPRLTGLLMEVIAREPLFIQALASTLLMSSKVLRDGGTVLPAANITTSTTNTTFAIADTGSPPLLCVMEKCHVYLHTHLAALQLLYRLIILCQSMENEVSDLIWSTFISDNDDLALTLCAQFLLTLQQKEFKPSNKVEAEEFDKITSPLVRHVLLETIHEKIVDTTMEEEADDSYTKSVLVQMQIPSVCLSLWTNPHLQTLAFELVSKMAMDEDMAVLFVEQKSTLQSLFELLAQAPTTTTTTSSTEVVVDDDENENENDIRGVVAHILQSLAESGVLTQAVQKFRLKSVAIAGLAQACTQDAAGETATSATLSSRCMECLVDLLSNNSNNNNSNKQKESSGTKIITEADATVIAKSLGSKICHMVLSRFLERAKLDTTYDINNNDDDEYDNNNNTICEAPYVVLLVAVSQHASSQKLLGQGGISALVLVAGEGHVPALRALQQHANLDHVFEAGGHTQLYKIFGDDDNDDNYSSKQHALPSRVAAMELLAQLSSTSKRRKEMVMDDDCLETLRYALHCIGALDTDTVVDDEEEEPELLEEEEEVVAESDDDDDDDADVIDDQEEEPEEEEEEPTAPAAPVVVTRRKKKKKKPEAALPAPPPPPSAPPSAPPADWMVPPPMPPPPAVPLSKPKQLTEAEKQAESKKLETKLQYVSLELLSNLVPLCLDRLSDVCSNLVPIVQELSKKEAFTLPALSFLQSLAPFCTKTKTKKSTTASSMVALDADVLTTVFVEALEDNNNKNYNMACKLVATRGLSRLILDTSSSLLQTRATQVLISLFQTAVKKCAVQQQQRSSSSSSLEKNNSRAVLAEWTCELVQVLVQVAPIQRELLSEPSVLVAMVHLIEWRYDARTITTTTTTTTSSSNSKNTTNNNNNNNNNNKEQFMYWNAAVPLALFHLSRIFFSLSEKVQQLLLTETVLVMARPGKAPRKTSNLQQTLLDNYYYDDAMAVVAARNLLSYRTK